MKKINLTEATILALENKLLKESDENQNLDFNEMFNNVKEIIKKSIKNGEIEKESQDRIELYFDDSYEKSSITRKIKKYFSGISEISCNSERYPNTHYSSNGYYIGSGSDGYSYIEFYIKNHYSNSSKLVIKSRNDGNYYVFIKE